MATRWQRERLRTPQTKITIETKVPSKWRFVDLETGEVWAWRGVKFIRTHDITVSIHAVNPSKWRKRGA